jgi:hypothetical protein
MHGIAWHPKPLKASLKLEDARTQKQLLGLDRTPMQALALYQELLRQEDPDPLYHTYSAACYFYMGQTQQAEAAVQQVRGGAAVAAQAVLLDPS